ncbi:MAG TPA: preprotein translocase subunit SecY [Streptosporangiaceae bacterium]|jgi:preprotein translocase subunit SecY|nr:preprotein translocase subunit SecY [Streptosporangiaceae bacterium]
MLTAFVRAFQTPDLRKKMLITLGLIALFRFGASVPTPGIDEKNVTLCSNLATSAGSQTAGVLAIVNLLSGQALLHLSVFALGIMPYITASIILQLLTVVIPRLETLKQEGQAGQSKITQYTRYLTVGLAVLQSTGYVELARSGTLFNGCGTATENPLIPHASVFTIATMVITMVAGTTVIMWMGELITDRGVGNGMSVLIFTTVISVIPGEILAIYRDKSLFYAAVAVVVVVFIVAFIVFMEQAQRRIPVQYAKRMVGRRMYGGTSTYIPMKVNQAGVIPVIFASSLLYIPTLAAQLFGNSTNPQGWVAWVDRYVEQSSSPLYMFAFFVLIIGFTYFYVSITFNPTEVSDNMKKYGGFIPGIRPGRPTAEYLSYVLSRLTAPGSFYLGVIALFPLVALSAIGVANEFPFSGVSLLIMVGVGLDTVKQIESQLQQRNYEGFLR